MMKAFAPLFAAVAIVATGALPTSAMAQRHYDRNDSRKASKEQWKDVAVVGGVVGLIGAATHNPTLAAVGAAGAAYGAVRYDNDRYGYRRDDDRNDRYGYGRNDDYRRRNDRRDDRRDGRSYGSGGYRDADRRRDDDRRYDDRGYNTSRRDDGRRDGRSHG